MSNWFELLCPILSKTTVDLLVKLILYTQNIKKKLKNYPHHVKWWRNRGKIEELFLLRNLALSWLLTSALFPCMLFMSLVQIFLKSFFFLIKQKKYFYLIRITRVILIDFLNSEFCLFLQNGFFPSSERFVSIIVNALKINISLWIRITKNLCL